MTPAATAAREEMRQIRPPMLASGGLLGPARLSFGDRDGLWASAAPHDDTDADSGCRYTDDQAIAFTEIVEHC